MSKASETGFAEILAASEMKPWARLSDVQEVYRYAARYGLRSICIPLVYLPDAREIIGSDGLSASTIVSFPTGLSPVSIKIMEMRLAFENGAQEIYFYPNIGNYLDNRLLEFEWELSKIVEESQLIGVKHLKPVLEAEALAEYRLSEMLENTGFETLAVSSGFGLKGFSREGFNVLRSIVEPGISVEVFCNAGSVQDVQTIIEHGAVKVYTVGYKTLLEEALGKHF
ncbi:MAG: hypothetical protein ACUVQ0_02990 [Thermoproteota archaeon]